MSRSKCECKRASFFSLAVPGSQSATSKTYLRKLGEINIRRQSECEYYRVAEAKLKFNQISLKSIRNFGSSPPQRENCQFFKK